MNKDIVAIILAGGKGSRLKEITNKIAKPAVSFGGRHRIIDYTLSNCLHSDIESVGVVTQYEPLKLLKHLGNGSPWDLDIETYGLTILSPYTSDREKSWFNGTADAVYSNRDYLNLYKPENVLILSGDHIYNMDYRKMLNYHVEKDSDLTIAVRSVELSEAHRFGIMNTDESNRIIEFEEKPVEPKSNLASMGIYIFKYDKLMEMLEKDSKLETSSHDFGKDIIPEMISKGLNVFLYGFKGYWRDVGTVESLWQANQELLRREFVSKQLVYTRNRSALPQFFAEDSITKNSIVCEGASNYGEIDMSIISVNSHVEKDAKVNYSVVMPRSTISENCEINYAIVMPELVVPEGTIINGTSDNIILVTEEMVNEGGSHA